MATRRSPSPTASPDDRDAARTVQQFGKAVAELHGARLARYRVRLGIQLTTACPVGCRHCLWACRPDLWTDIPEVLLVRVLHEWRSMGGEEVGLTGGEPFVRPRLLDLAVRTARPQGLAVSVATSAYWATSERTAMRILEPYRGIAHLAISIDRYHSERVPPQRVLNAIRAARRLGIEISLLLVLSERTGADDLAPFAKHLFREIKPEMVRRAGLLNAGRATELPSGRYGTARAVCGGLDVPLVMSTGDLWICCAYSAGDERTAPFWRGNLVDIPLATALHEEAADYWLLQALRAGGPALCAQLAGHDPGEDHPGSICRRCRALFRDPRATTEVRMAVRDPLNRLEIARLLGQRRGETEPMTRYVLDGEE